MSGEGGLLTDFQRQLDAIGSALILISKLPHRTVWSLCCTNDDDMESPSVLNIFAMKADWQRVRDALKMGEPVDTDENFLSFREGTLLISIIEPTEETDDE